MSGQQAAQAHASAAPASLTAHKNATALSPSALIAAASHSYLAAVAHLSGGCWLLKYPFSEKGGAPQRRFLFYCVDEAEGDCLWWTDGDKKRRSKSKCLPLTSVTGVMEAAQTAAFKKAIVDRRLEVGALDCCFSIVGSKRTLDMQAASKEERDKFIAALHCVMTHKQLNLKQQAVAVARAKRNSIAAEGMTGAQPLSPSASVPMSSPVAPAPQRDLFVISVKARNLPVMPWCEDDSNTTMVCIYEKSERTGGVFSFVESSEWQHSNAMPNFRTPLLLPITLPIAQSDLIKIVAFDQQQDEAHVIGSVVVRAEFFMKNAGHEMMVKLKHSANEQVERLLAENNTYLLLTSTCRSGGPSAGAGGQSAAPRKQVSVAAKQQFGSVMEEFQSALQHGRPQSQQRPQHQRSQSAVPRKANGVASLDRRPLGAGGRSQGPAGDAEDAVLSRARAVSVQLPKTVLAFLQAGDVFTFYPPRKPIAAASSQPEAPCRVSVQLKMKGDYGALVLRPEREQEDEREESVSVTETPADSLLVIPFELLYQAKNGCAPGCFVLPSPSLPRPKPPRCLSLLVKTSSAPDAKLAYWLDLECRSHAARNAWVQAVTEVVAYIHMPKAQPPPAAVERKTIPVEQLQEGEQEQRPREEGSQQPEGGAALTASKGEAVRSVGRGNGQTSPGDPSHWEQDGGSEEAGGSTSPGAGGHRRNRSRLQSETSKVVMHVSANKRLSIFGSSEGGEGDGDGDGSALALFDPPPAQRSALDVARKAGKKLGNSNLIPSIDTTKPVAPPAIAAPPSPVPLPPPRVAAVAPAEETPTEGIKVDDIPAAPPLAPVFLPSDDGDVPCAPPMAPDAPSLSAAVPAGPKLRRLHWYAGDGDDIAGTLWGDDAEEEDAEARSIGDDGQKLLVDLFTLADARTLTSGRKEEKAQLSIFDSKRTQNIEIALRAFRMPHEALHEAVLSMDMTILNAERIASLISCCPTAEELLAMQRWTAAQPLPSAPDFSTLPRPEQFAFLMHSIPQYPFRLRSMLFRLRFAETADSLCRQLVRLSKACKAVRDSRQFRKVLRLILSIGNLMNRSKTRSFHLSTLDELSRTKSADGRYSLLDFMVHYLALRGWDSSGMQELGQLLHQVIIIDVAQLLEDKERLLQGRHELGVQLQQAEAAQQQDAFHEQMLEFLHSTQELSSRLQDASAAFAAWSDDLLLYCNERSELTLSELFAILDRFCIGLRDADSKRMDRLKREEAMAGKEGRAGADGKHRRHQTSPAVLGSAGLSSVLSGVNVSKALKARAEDAQPPLEQLAEDDSTWED